MLYTFKFLPAVLMISFLLQITSCKKEVVPDRNVVSLNDIEFNETIWYGTLIKSARPSYPVNIRIVYNTENYGNYLIPDEYSETIKDYSLNTNFRMKKTEKSLFFEDDYNNILVGQWFINNSNSTKKQLVFIRTTDKIAVSDTLKIAKKML